MSNKRYTCSMKRSCCVLAGSGPNAYNPDSMMGASVQSSKPRAPRFTISSRSAHGGYLADNAQPVRTLLHTLPAVLQTSLMGSSFRISSPMYRVGQKSDSLFNYINIMLYKLQNSRYVCRLKLWYFLLIIHSLTY